MKRRLHCLVVGGRKGKGLFLCVWCCVLILTSLPEQGRNGGTTGVTLTAADSSSELGREVEEASGASPDHPYMILERD